MLLESLIGLFAVLVIFNEPIVKWLEAHGVSKRRRIGCSVALVSLAVVVLPLLKESRTAQDEQRREAKLDNIERMVGEIFLEQSEGTPVATPTAPPKRVESGAPQRPFRGSIGLTPEDQGWSIGFWYTARRIEGTIIPGRVYLLDLPSETETRGRVSAFIETVFGENFLTAEVFDTAGNAHVVRQSLSGWKDGSRHLIFLRRNAQENVLHLSIDAEDRQKITLGDASLGALGPDLYVGGPFSAAS